MAMMLRPSEQRGQAHYDWLEARHSFSFAHYYDPAHMGFRSLRVINEDIVRPGTGFPTHGHANMEIVTYIVRGALAHKDSTGGQGVLHRGEVQSMSAGTGVRHSEFNASDKEDLRLLQIWLMPNHEGLEPAYQQTSISDEAKKNTLHLITAYRGQDGALPIQQDARIYASLADPNITLTHELAAGRGAWIQLVDGELDVNGQPMKSGDGLAIEDIANIGITAKKTSEFLLFDLA